MKKNVFGKITICLLSLALLTCSSKSIAKDLTSPPYELLQGKTGKEKLDILARWEEADPVTRESITAYFDCQRDLASLNKQLDSAKGEKELKELQKNKALEDLKKLLLKAALRITGGAFVISTDAAADLYLAGKAVKQAISESITSKDGEQVKVQEEDAAEAQRLTNAASKRQQYVASLEKALAEAEQKVKAAEANRVRVASSIPPGEQTASTPRATGPKKVQTVIKNQIIKNQHGTVIWQGDVEVQPTLDRIKAGQPYPHGNDGTFFQNRIPTGKSVPPLPVMPYQWYVEYVHPTPGMSGPGPQRIVIGRGGEIYYTPDHYNTFIRLNP